ncbi:hypothetical protein VKT23_007596 [Stygiomarasmius scandens]|uniref:Uncharacterized protein n=1 Tax=Marasmiellus scandens TaxID=2682957 RepID=A0ABR1JKA8_9AGAR
MYTTRSGYQKPSTVPIPRRSAPVPSDSGLTLPYRRLVPKSLSSPTDTSSLYSTVSSKPLKINSADQLRQICEDTSRSQKYLSLCVEGTCDFCEEQIIEVIDALPWRRSIRIWKKSTGLFLEFMASTVHEFCAEKFSRLVEEAFSDAANEPKPDLPFEPMGSRSKLLLAFAEDTILSNAYTTWDPLFLGIEWFVEIEF